MTCLIQAFSALQYEYLAWRTVDLLGALPHTRKRVILVATRDGINPHDILFEANPKCECEEIRRSGEKKRETNILLPQLYARFVKDQRTHQQFKTSD